MHLRTSSHLIRTLSSCASTPSVLERGRIIGRGCSRCARGVCRSRHSSICKLSRCCSGLDSCLTFTCFQPPRPVSTYVDPADRVAKAPVKAQADDIQTWVLSEVDKKGKKKKGTLGVGNGSVFFASESDKVRISSLTLTVVELQVQLIHKRISIR